MSITHSAKMNFFEERDRSQPGFPDKIVGDMKYLEDCDWKQSRDDLSFQSNNPGVCIGVTLEDKSSMRKFKLEKLSFGFYNAADGKTRAIDHKFLLDVTTGKKSSLLEYHKWIKDERMLAIRIAYLNLGQV